MGEQPDRIVGGDDAALGLVGGIAARVGELLGERLYCLKVTLRVARTGVPSEQEHREALRQLLDHRLEGDHPPAELDPRRGVSLTVDAQQGGELAGQQR